MVRSVEGVYRDGRVDVLQPLDIADGANVIVTWVGSATSVDLAGAGIDREQAAGLRQRLATFVEDWDRPEMNAYDELPTG